MGNPNRTFLTSARTQTTYLLTGQRIGAESPSGVDLKRLIGIPLALWSETERLLGSSVEMAKILQERKHAYEKPFRNVKRNLTYLKSVKCRPIFFKTVLFRLEK